MGDSKIEWTQKVVSVLRRLQNGLADPNIFVSDDLHKEITALLDEWNAMPTVGKVIKESPCPTNQKT
jgi:hypothetical protein